VAGSQQLPVSLVSITEIDCHHLLKLSTPRHGFPDKIKKEEVVFRLVTQLSRKGVGGGIAAFRVPGNKGYCGRSLGRATCQNFFVWSLEFLSTTFFSQLRPW